jgi:hypothetical protein
MTFMIQQEFNNIRIQQLKKIKGLQTSYLLG